MKYTFFWLTGNKEVLEGSTPAKALTLAGYSNGAIRALDFYSQGSDDSYKWDSQKKTWVKNKKLS